MNVFSKIILLAFTMTVASVGLCQTPSSVMYSAGKAEEEKKAAGVSVFNPWFGAQLSYKFKGTDEFSDNILVSGKIMHDIKNNSSNFRLPVVGNISDLKSDILQNKEAVENAIKDVVISDQGLNIGLYPYFILNEYNDDDFYLLLHGGASWKLNAFKTQTDTSNVDYLNTGRFSAGIEIGFGLMKTEDGLRPVTFSFTPVLSVFDKEDYNKIFGEEKGSIVSFESTAIVPISNTGIGVMLEYVFSADVESSFRAGVILVGKSKETKP